MEVRNNLSSLGVSTYLIFECCNIATNIPTFRGQPLPCKQKNLPKKKAFTKNKLKLVRFFCSLFNVTDEC